MNKRVEKLRSESFEATPGISIERALLVTDYYKEYFVKYSIPVMRAFDVFGTDVTLIHVDAHLDWRDDINGEKEGYSSPIRRASEMPWIDKIVQIGMRGIGSARQQEVDDAPRGVLQTAWPGSQPQVNLVC